MVVKYLSLISLVCLGWTLQIKDTPTNTVALNIKEENSNIWAFEQSFDAGVHWTFCQYATGNVAQVMYKNPPTVIFRARLVQ